MTLAGIELRYLVGEISSAVSGYYVSNIYGISQSDLLFKMHHPEKPDIFLMVSTSGIWISRVRIDQIAPNRLLRRFRNDLVRLKITDIRQIGAERIAYITFGGFGKEFVLVCEFFSDGNIILCDPDMKILALLHSIDVRHRQLRVGLQYVPPPLNGLDIFEVSRRDIAPVSDAAVPCAKWVGRNLGLPARYAEEICRRAGIDGKAQNITESQADALHGAITTLAGDISQGRHEAVLVGDGDRLEAYPVRLGGAQGEVVPGGFMEALDRQFTEDIVRRGKESHSDDIDREIAQLQNRLAEQDRAIETVQERSRQIAAAARTVQELAGRGATISDDGGALAAVQARLITEKGISKIEVAGQKIPVSAGMSMQAIASRLYDESKKQAGAVPAIQETRARTESQIAKLQAKAKKSRDGIGFSEVRKRNWFERYRWFYTSEGYLAIGGRDAASNSSVIRKHMADGDIIFHAEVFGSPFFILKDGENAGEMSMTEVAQATVCFSRGWREAMYGLSAYWVRPDQVKKSAPSGQFLPKGSFTIEGKRNFVRMPGMKLAVGLIPEGDNILLTCGPVEPVTAKSRYHCIIEPTGDGMSDIAKKIRLKFLEIGGDLAKSFSVDDYVRVLPAGASHIAGAGGSQ